MRSFRVTFDLGYIKVILRSFRVTFDLGYIQVILRSFAAVTNFTPQMLLDVDLFLIKPFPKVSSDDPINPLSGTLKVFKDEEFDSENINLSMYYAGNEKG